MEEKKIVALFGIGGLGKAICEKLIQIGYKLILFDIKNEEDELLKEIIKNNDQVLKYYKTDIRNIKKVRENIEKAYKEFGFIDAMVYTSGITRGVLFENIEEKDWDIVFDINLKGAFFSVQAISKIMNKNGGAIVLISSIASRMAAGNTSFAYNASKAALDNLAKSLAKKLGERNITVNTVNPGDVWTPLWESDDIKKNEELKNKFEQHVSKQCIKKEVLPQDIAEAVAYYLSENASKTTGQHLFIDGGNF
ncbi:SDR family NAD(P)-dependent oxidoreductase [Thomasclavelia sp.]|uniref:SDR family NAD(P)-dependent oxidoreductase n=1 Tax=Thomasclavelia sp. TaxID=3025757 RepID=UPI0025FA4A24|nr:SDR family oxidoreductase [Thomasclavelia sp.]